MSAVRYWTPRYLGDRVRVMLHEWTNPSDPWFTQQATRLLESLLRPDDVGVEWGSGRSTLWFARLVAKLVSVEHNQAWYERVLNQLKRSSISNVDYRLAPVGDGGQVTAWGDTGSYHLRNNLAQQSRAGTAVAVRTNPYAEVVEEFAPSQLGFVSVDGMWRGECALRSLPKLRPGGLMIVDNINWFLPCASTAPGSRAIDAKPASDEWAEFSRLVREWRYVWTSNGVSDTAVWLKP
ncbi:MAG: hypothetical protein EPO21_10830 [Chloroflexota bacterium]|nr:MAG: hypothetical protein EPO21_10830 [Chloroflexota bacterium]